MKVAHRQRCQEIVKQIETLKAEKLADYTIALRLKSKGITDGDLVKALRYQQTNLNKWRQWACDLVEALKIPNQEKHREKVKQFMTFFVRQNQR